MWAFLSNENHISLEEICSCVCLCLCAILCLLGFGLVSVLVKWKLKGFSQYPLGVTAMWCDVFETANPQGWLLLSFILILFNILLFIYLFLMCFEAQRTLSLQLLLPPPPQLCRR